MDEKENPLFFRLPLLRDMLIQLSEEHDFDFICLQEVRPTAGWSSDEVIHYFSDALQMSYVHQNVNPSDKAFTRVTFYDKRKWFHSNSKPVYTPNNKKPNHPYMLLVSSFTRANSLNVTETEFVVINAHAPVSLEDKKQYWKTCNLVLREIGEEVTTSSTPTPFCVLVGDVNKFSDQWTEYKKCALNGGVEDLVDTKITTFVSFDHDTQPDGSLYTSSLDAILVMSKFVPPLVNTNGNETHSLFSSVKTSIHSTEKECTMDEIMPNIYEKCEKTANVKWRNECKKFMGDRIYDAKQENLDKTPQREECKKDATIEAFMKIWNKPMRPTDHFGVSVEFIWNRSNCTLEAKKI